MWQLKHQQRRQSFAGNPVYFASLGFAVHLQLSESSTHVFHSHLLRCTPPLVRNCGAHTRTKTHKTPSSATVAWPDRPRAIRSSQHCHIPVLKLQAHVQKKNHRRVKKNNFGADVFLHIYTFSLCAPFRCVHRAPGL